jgi:hypothetical protein
MTRIIIAALAALAIAAPAATAMPSDAVVGPQTGTAVSPQSDATNTPSGCPSGTREVQGVAGSACTTSPRNNWDEFGVSAVILTSAGAFAIALGAGAAAGRRRGRASTVAAFSGRTS